MSVASVCVLAAVLTVFPRFLAYIESRPGVRIADPVLYLFTPLDLTWVTFALIYAGLVVALIVLSRHPVRFLLALQAYTIMVVVRMVVMYVAPFEPPATMIPLNDPFVQLFGSGQILTKDLFFSGHTATLLVLAFAADRPWLRFSYFAMAGLVGVCVILQHVHYTADVLVAIPFAYLAYRLASVLVSFIAPPAAGHGVP